MAHSTPALIPSALVAGLNAEQEQAVRTLDGPLLVVAGPGSGKTRVLTHRIAALLATGVTPGSILAVTFTNKAAAEMRHRVASLVGQGMVRHMWIATFHSACVRILRANHAAAGLPRSFSIADTNDTAKLVAEALEANGELTDLSPTDRKKVVKDTCRIISTAKNNDQGPADLLTSHHADYVRAGHAMEPYNRALRARGAVDFDDILLLVLHLLRDHPNIAAHYTARFSHVLIDEFQDTNTVQWNITQLLGGQGNVCVVGDADQSIYAFRGANPGVLSHFTNAFPDTQVVRLGRNYRSTGNIVDVAQAVIDPNPALHRARMSTQNAAGEPVRVVKLDRDLDEARWVADQIASRGGPLGDHAVLVRTNAQTRALEMILRERGVAHDVVGTVRFFDRLEVKDALSYLRLVVNPIDVGALERAVTAPRRGIGPATLAKVTGDVLAGRSTITQALTDAVREGSGRGVNALRSFLTALESVAREVVNDGPAAGLAWLIDEGGLADFYTGKKVDNTEGAERVDNLKELTQSAADFVTGHAGNDAQGRDIADLDGLEQTEAFLEYAALMSSAEKPDDPATGGLNTNAVQIATMHAAKGKEWKHVYVVGVEEDILPHVRAHTADDLAEERRLLFVAVSRAQETLDLTHVDERRMFNDTRCPAPSRFLDDMPASVEFSEQSTTRQRPALGPLAAGGSPRRFGGGPRPGAHSRSQSSTGGGWSLPPAAQRGGSASATGAGRTPLGVRAAPTPPVNKADTVPSASVPPGTRVEHATLGVGTVLENRGQIITVRFATSVKALSLQHAPLTIAD